jgi:predicted DNA-binding transcriptional regulator YafY
LSAAVQQRQQARLVYRSWSGEETDRAFDAYGIVFNEGYWYVAGYCHLRHDLRTFRLDRIVTVEPLEQSFERPDEFDALAHVINSLALMPGTEQIEVLMETTMERARQVLPPILGTLEPAENGVMFRRAAIELEWTAHILLNLDFPIHVLKPAALRDKLREMARRGLQMVGDET